MPPLPQQQFYKNSYIIGGVSSLGSDARVGDVERRCELTGSPYTAVMLSRARCDAVASRDRSFSLNVGGGQS